MLIEPGNDLVSQHAGCPRPLNCGDVEDFSNDGGHHLKPEQILDVLLLYCGCFKDHPCCCRPAIFPRHDRQRFYRCHEGDHDKTT